MGLVGTNKRVVREENHGSLLHRYLNMIQCLYLERHNFEIRSTNAVDGGVFVISGRTSLVRTQVVANIGFCTHYTNDYWLFGCIGPLAVDDDNFLTRWCVAHGWKIRVQYCPETLVTTTLGSYSKFSGGLRRWVRTTWRSNCTSLTIAQVWRTQPWCIYAVYLSSFTNFALFYDVALLYVFSRSSIVQGPPGSLAFIPLVFWMIFFKMVKPFAYFWRHPKDITLIPAYFLFTYFHSFIKLWGLLTVWDCGWSGRNLHAINNEATAKPSNNENRSEAATSTVDTQELSKSEATMGQGTASTKDI